MKPQMRRMIAYVIARVVASTDSNTIYDYQEIAYFSFNASFTGDLIQVQDYSNSNYIKGEIITSQDKKEIKLYDPINITKIGITVSTDSESKNQFTFSGIGRGHAMKFHGVVTKDGKVSFYDSSTGMYYKLKI